MGYYYPNGLSDKAGAHRLLTLPIYTSSQVVYVDSNAVSGGNGSYNRPYQTNTAADGVAAFIVVKDGSAEVLLAGPTSSSYRTVVGEVSAGGLPSASLGVGYAGNIVDTSTYQQWVNLTFTAPTVATPGAARFTTAAGCRFVDCRFEEDSVSGERDVNASGAGTSAEGCTFVSTAATAATAPGDYALDIDGAAVRVIDCVFDDGAYGRTSNNGGPAVYGGGGERATRVYGANLLRSAKISGGGAEDTSFEGIVNITLATQGGGFRDQDEIWTLHPAGISDGLGDRLLTSDPVYTSGQVYYVDSVNGDDTNDGDPEEPYATLRAAFAANGATETVFVLRNGHAETLSTQLEIDAIGVTVIGEGDPSDSSDCATLDITIGQGLLLSAAGVEFRNVRFEATGAIASPLPATNITGAGGAMEGCYFELGVDPNMSALALTASYTRAVDCDFVNVATTEAARPYAAFGHGTTSLSGILIKDCTVDGGTTGFTGWAVDCDTAGALLGTRGENLILLNGADAKVHEDSTGYLQVTASDTSKVEAF